LEIEGPLVQGDSFDDILMDGSRFWLLKNHVTVIFKYIYYYFSLVISFGVFKAVPHLGSESCITLNMGMAQHERATFLETNIF
jgi:hypothetical protein